MAILTYLDAGVLITARRGKSNADKIKAQSKLFISKPYAAISKVIRRITATRHA